MMKKKSFISKLFSNDLGIDLGTSNVRIYVEGQGIAVREPSVVAMDTNTGKVLTVGAAARNMLGRTPGNVIAVHPLQDGVISDQEMTVLLLKALFRKALRVKLFSPKPRVVISVPCSITEVEERTVINSAIEAGARRVYLIRAPLAAGLGTGTNLEKAEGHMVVDIGGGTTDVGVLTMSNVATCSAIKVGGNTFDEAIARLCRRKYGVVIGQATAEDVKMEIGCVYPRQEDVSMNVKGRDLKTGLPREITLYSSEILEVLQRPARQIVDEVLNVLEDTSPELVGDIARSGIMLTGGSSLLYGMAQLLTERTGINCEVCDNPQDKVAVGSGMSLAWINTMSEGPINVARRRLMQE